MNFDGFSSVDFLPINRELPAFVYVLFWISESGEVPFYVGQTTRIWGRMDDYYWATFSAATDFRVGEAVRHLGARGYRVIIKYKATREPLKDEAAIIDDLRPCLKAEGRELLNDLSGFNYRVADELAERSRIHDFIGRMLMRPEPVVYHAGKVTDAGEHAPMLSNNEANALSDALALEAAKKLGFTDEELNLLKPLD
jgi:hypothetical protein